MNQLNLDTYHRIKRNASHLTSKDEWFKTSYNVFLKSNIIDKEDVIKMIAFAYSWMPTIPKFDETKCDWEFIVKTLNEFKLGHFEKRETLINQMLPLVNKSLVGVSKVLHFINPDKIPIIDSRVYRAWNSIFQENKEIPKIRSDYSSNVNNYLQYWDLLTEWKNRCGSNSDATIRSLEESLYLYKA